MDPTPVFMVVNDMTEFNRLKLQFQVIDISISLSVQVKAVFHRINIHLIHLVCLPFRSIWISQFWQESVCFLIFIFCVCSRWLLFIVVSDFIWWSRVFFSLHLMDIDVRICFETLYLLFFFHNLNIKAPHWKRGHRNFEYGVAWILLSWKKIISCTCSVWALTEYCFPIYDDWLGSFLLYLFHF